MSSEPLHGLHVITIGYLDSTPAAELEPVLAAYAERNVYAQAGVPFDVEAPVFPEEQRAAEATDNLGMLGGKIAEAVAQGRRAGSAVLMTGGNCTHITGVLGGLQDAHGPHVKVGLVWFDAHGDFNTPKTTLSGMLGGMPVAVCAGLAYPRWREWSHIVAPLPTDRIVMVDVRNLDAPEEQLIRATDVTIVPVAGDAFEQAIGDLAGRCDMIYFHIDSDILDESLVPNHATKEPNGPGMAQVTAAIETVMATGKVAVFAVVSVFGKGAGREIAITSGVELIRHGLEAWAQHGTTSVPTQPSR
jgi:arginase